MSNGSLDIKLRRKAVFLVGDLAEFQLQNTDQKAELPIFSDRLFLKSVVDLILVLDLDLQEKVKLLTGHTDLIILFLYEAFATHLLLTSANLCKYVSGSYRNQHSSSTQIHRAFDSQRLLRVARSIRENEAAAGGINGG